MPTLSRKQAIKDCQEIWKYMAISGCFYKHIAIEKLKKKNKISRSKYSFDCPLCHLYYENPKCEKCPWPGEGGIRCVSGLFGNWEYIPIGIGDVKEFRKNLQKAASAIYKLSKTFV